MVNMINQYLRNASECVVNMELIRDNYSVDSPRGVRQSQFEKAGTDLSIYFAYMAFYGRYLKESGDYSSDSTANSLRSRAGKLTTWLLGVKESLPEVEE
tara:strand:+ start:1863 stop:2159 length:297 start_codon:yes stop_codon:yes gene_type:complete